ncbi:MAG: alpha/beta hydrolase [Algicola sp.]|nr:alpha/beta hydrolase [Algicola sp.]
MFKSAIFSLGLMILCASTTPVLAGEAITIGETHTITSSVMAEQRKILISLPTSYAQNKDKTYPVLYLLDGDSHFHQTTGIVNWLSNSLIPELIVVGVPNTNRGRDLSPTLAENGKPQGAEKFMGFFEKELLPYIDKHYRTAPYRVLTGHSMGGMFGLNVLATKPDLFDAFILMSPWLLTQDPATSVLTKSIKFIKSQTQLPKYIYVTLGEEPDLRPSFDQLTTALKNSTAQKLVWQSKVIQGATHMSVVGASVNEGLQAVFSDLKLSMTSDTVKKGAAAIIKYYKTLSSTKYGFDISAESTLMALGRDLFFAGKIKQSEAALKMAVQTYPESVEGFYSLSYLYQQEKDFEQALVAVDKAIELLKKAQSPGLADFEQLKAQLLKQQSEQKLKNNK